MNYNIELCGTVQSTLLELSTYRIYSNSLQSTEEIRYRHCFQPFLNLTFLSPHNYDTFRRNYQEQFRRLQEDGGEALSPELTRTLEAMPPEERSKVLAERAAAVGFA